MPDAPQTAPTTAPAAQVAPVAPPPQDASTGLTAGSSLDDLLRAEPLPVGGAKPVLEVPGDSGRSVAGIKNEPQGDVALPPEPPPVPAEAQAPTEPPPEPVEESPTAIEEPPPVFDEQRAIEELTRQKTDLLRTQGRKNQELGDLRRQVAELQQQVQMQAQMPQAAPQPAISPEDLAARLLENPAAVITGLVSPLVEHQARAIAQQVIAQQSEQWQAQQEQEAAAIAPEVGKDLFLQRHGIKQDFNSWLVSDPEGQAVNALFERDENRTVLLEAYRDRGDIKGIADTLTSALKAHRLGKKAAQGRIAQNGEKARIEAAHPPSAPLRPATPLPASVTPPQEKSIFDPTMTEADLVQWMKGAQQWERDAQ